MSGLIWKCAALVLIIHGLRFLGRRVGPRFSGLILGLPITSAVVLAMTAWERGESSALEMSEASMLGLSAAIVIPVFYARMVASGWTLGAAMAVALAAYLTVAGGLGMIGVRTAAGCLSLSSLMLVLAAHFAGRIREPRPRKVTRAPTPRMICFLRTVIPIFSLSLIGLAQTALRPGLAGLVGSFPSMSVVMLAVTHLEAGPREASRLARALPLGNLSTLLYLTVFRFGTPQIGLAWSVACGYAAALLVLGIIDGRMRAQFEHWRPAWSAVASGWNRTAIEGKRRTPARHVGLCRGRLEAREPAHPPLTIRRAIRNGFLPRFEVLRC